MTEDWADKTEPATPYRRAEARRRGEVARSGELSAAVLCLAAVLLIHHGGPKLAIALKAVLTDSLTSSSSTTPFMNLARIGTALAPIAAGLVLIGLAANLVQTGFLFARRSDAKPLNAIAGVARIFSGRSFVTGMLGTGKLLVVALIAYLAVRGQMRSLLALQTLPAGQAVGTGLALVYAVAIRVVVALLALALLDYAYQRFTHERSLRMSRREVKEETRRQEGDPDMKRRRRNVAAAWAVSRLQRDVSLADVVITGAGDSAAVALKFDPRSMTSPRVLAKGVGLVARQMRETAIGKGIPVVELSTLAASLASNVGVGRDVPARFHAELAETFAYVMELGLA